MSLFCDSLTSPQLTAEWETRLTGIAKGSDSPADFMRGIEEMTAGLVKTYSAISEDKAKLFTPQREAIGTCPRCGAAVYEGKKNFYCSDRACSFVMWKNDRFFEQRKKAFTKAIAAALLKDGKVKIKGMYSTKTGKTFDGVVLLADTGGKYVTSASSRTEMIRLDEKQYRAVKKMTRAACANNDCGNCLLLDDGETCVCVQSISYSLLCRYFREAVLPADRQLCEQITRSGETDLKRCAVCGSTFAAGSNRAKYCPDCAAKIRRRQKAQSERNRRLRIKTTT